MLQDFHLIVNSRSQAKITRLSAQRKLRGCHLFVIPRTRAQPARTYLFVYSRSQANPPRPFLQSVPRDFHLFVYSHGRAKPAWTSVRPGHAKVGRETSSHALLFVACRLPLRAERIIKPGRKTSFHTRLSPLTGHSEDVRETSSHDILSVARRCPLRALLRDRSEREVQTPSGVDHRAVDDR